MDEISLRAKPGVKKYVGVIYLLHFDMPLGHAQHYMGWTADLDTRLVRHASGHSAVLTEVFRSKRIGFTLARCWRGTRDAERRLKRRHNGRRLCPICSPKKGQGR